MFGFGAHSKGRWQVFKDFLMRYRFGDSSNDCLSEEKTGSTLKSKDWVRALLFICVRLECSKLGHHLSQPKI